MIKKYNVRTPNYYFYIYVQFLLEDVINIQAKYKNDSCSTITFQTYENTAYLDSFHHNFNCAFNVKTNTVGLKKKEGTYEYFRGILTFLFRKFPKLEGCVLKDTSNIKSKLNREVYISLRDVYLAAYNKTWYQYHFGAKPIVEKGYEQLINVSETFNEHISTNFKEFFEKYCYDVVSNKQFSLLKDAFYKFVDKPVSLREFVIYCKKNYDWLIFDKWISRLVSKSFPMGVLEQMNWVIFPESILGIPDDKKLQVEIYRVSAEDEPNIGFHGMANTFNYYWKKYSHKMFYCQSFFPKNLQNKFQIKLLE